MELPFRCRRATSAGPAQSTTRGLAGTRPNAASLDRLERRSRRSSAHKAAPARRAQRPQRPHVRTSARPRVRGQDNAPGRGKPSSRRHVSWLVDISQRQKMSIARAANATRARANFPSPRAANRPLRAFLPPRWTLFRRHTPLPLPLPHPLPHPHRTRTRIRTRIRTPSRTHTRTRSRSRSRTRSRSRVRTRSRVPACCPAAAHCIHCRVRNRTARRRRPRSRPRTPQPSGDA
jgi:hypothetical protein